MTLEQMTVRELVVQYPQIRATLEAHRVDYCCGGTKGLAEAAQAAGVDPRELVDELERQIASTSAGAGEAARDWSGAALDELADHIEQTHHAYMRANLPRLDALLAKVGQAHRAAHGAMLEQVHGRFRGLRAEIEQHLLKEEQVLFPFIRNLVAQSRSGSARAAQPPMVVHPIRQMEHEHDQAGEALAAMRSLTDDYTLPDDACPSFTALYEGLEEMERDLHEHIHLENNILFPRAIELERTVNQR